MGKRIFLIVLDSFGIGEMPDAADYQDVGSSTVRALVNTGELSIDNLKKLGLFHIDGLTDLGDGLQKPLGALARLAELSKGKDTTIGHWEIAGVVSKQPLPTFPEGFPEALIKALRERTGREILCNRPYSGTEVIKDYGREHMETGALIVYTSADSVLQIAAHEEIVPLAKLYEYCEIARELCTGDWGVGRIIARPFIGEAPNFTRTKGRHDYSLKPPKKTILNALSENGKEVLAIGKINDIFAGSGITDTVRTANNDEGMEKTLAWQKRDFEGLCFTNLVDFDMVYGHRNDAVGYTRALNAFDKKLPLLMEGLSEEDLLMITADHGCDPSTASTDHSREYVPLLIYGKKVAAGTNLGTIDGFGTIAATIADCFGLDSEPFGNSVYKNIIKE